MFIHTKRVYQAFNMVKHVVPLLLYKQGGSQRRLCVKMFPLGLQGAIKGRSRQAFSAISIQNGTKLQGCCPVTQLSLFVNIKGEGGIVHVFLGQLTELKEPDVPFSRYSQAYLCSSWTQLAHTDRSYIPYQPATGHWHIISVNQRGPATLKLLSLA